MQVSKAVAGTDRARLRKSGVSATYRHHGVWAPGVRLVRPIQFRSKALNITVVLLIPVVLPTWSFLRVKAEAIEFWSTDDSGFADVREAVPLVRLGQANRARTLQMLAKSETSTSEVNLALLARDGQMQKLESVESARGADLGTSKALATVRTAADAAKSASPATAFNVQTASAAGSLSRQALLLSSCVARCLPG